MYFITLVTQHRECSLGTIKNGVMILSDFGKIVNDEWLKSFDIRDELYLDEYIIMPNHLHAIVMKNNSGNQTDKMDGTGHAALHIETHGRASLHSNNHSNNQPKLFRKSKSISSFVAGYKSAVNSKIDDYIDLHQLKIPKYNRNNHFFQYT
jgi:putative transposase